jgi:DNA-binding NtrC family response regulator
MPPAALPLPAPVRPRVVIVDLDRRVQQSLADVLELGGLSVVGIAGDVRTALEAVERTRPDVLLIDPRLPDVTAGEALLSSLARGWPSMRVVLMGWSEGLEHATPGPRHAVVPKNADPDAFVAAAIEACCPA